jgi:serine/threonine protein phosphatase PrpC
VRKAQVANKPLLYFHYAGLTDTGLIRDHNEDAYKLPEDADADTLSAKGHLYILADGMGGHQKGEVASAVTIETVNQEYYAIVKPLVNHDPEQAIITALTQAIQKANYDVMDVTEGGGTTIVAAVLYGDSLVAMNVGDSRAYLLRGNELSLITRDHSLVSRLVEMGKITEAEALTHPRRNVLYQALGQGTEVEIHTYSQKLQNDDIVILCSDGLWGEVSEPNLKQVLNNAPSPLAAAEQLIELANASGGSDNITAIIIHVSDQAIPGERLIAPKATDDDTNPSLKVNLQKPQTLPEGKYHTDKNP